MNDEIYALPCAILELQKWWLDVSPLFLDCHENNCAQSMYVVAAGGPKAIVLCAV